MQTFFKVQVWSKIRNIRLETREVLSAYLHPSVLRSNHFVLCSSDPCKFVACTNQAKCEEQVNGSTHCVCQSREKCPDTVEPVCGSNRKSYDNECLFKADACGSNMTFKQGRCGE